MAHNNSNTLRPGDIAPASGQYNLLGRHGELIREVTSVKGEHLPPSPESGCAYVLVDPTRNKSGFVYRRG